jgi:hypothetical protein
MNCNFGPTKASPTAPIQPMKATGNKGLGEEGRCGAAALLPVPWWFGPRYGVRCIWCI